jgi:hypothetical protein
MVISFAPPCSFLLRAYSNYSRARHRFPLRRQPNFYCAAAPFVTIFGREINYGSTKFLLSC